MQKYKGLFLIDFSGFNAPGALKSWGGRDA
jgi:hypothetical protein